MNKTVDTQDKPEISPIDNRDLLILYEIYKGAPSIHEMRKAIGARSTGTVAHRLKRLEHIGYVRQDPNRSSRSRVITKEGLYILNYCAILPDDIYAFEVMKLDAPIQLPS